VRFEALYHADRLQVVNPHGDVGLVTLWSPVRTVRRKLDAIAPELLDPERSRLAVVANLYGDGMYAMFCNLLFNPQVRHLVAVGEDLGLPTAHEIEAFLSDGLEQAEMLGRTVTRVRGTTRVLPSVAAFDADRLRRGLTFRYLGRLSRPELPEELTAHLHALPRTNGHADRLRVDVPTAVADDYAYRPSEPAGHQVIRRRPLHAWQELVVRTMRFGRPVTLASGPRLELRNARAVITDPADEPAEALAAHGFDLERFRTYQREMLDPALPEDVAYTYGHRLRGRFDTLETAIELLRADPETRGAYVALWDTATDLVAGEQRSTPCLTTLFFRMADGRLTLTATYRAHNLLTAWLMNVYGLMAVQRHVAEAAGAPPGSLTVLSHSLGIDPRSPRFELAEAIAAGWRRDDDVDHETGKSSLREDPNGYFVVSADRERGRIVAEHRFEGVLVKRYEAARASTIEHEVSADMAVSLISHALWLGRELTRAEQLLR
jgi:thymidylate synthase